MSRKRSKFYLTDAKVAALEAPDPSGKQKLFWDDDITGFGVLVSGVTNSRSYVVQRDVGGKSRRVTIGPCNIFTVEEARYKAVDVVKAMLEGRDLKVAEILGMSTAWVERARSVGYGPPFIRISPRAIRYRPDALRDWLEERAVLTFS